MIICRFRNGFFMPQLIEFQAHTGKKPSKNPLKWTMFFWLLRNHCSCSSSFLFSFSFPDSLAHCHTTTSMYYAQTNSMSIQTQSEREREKYFFHSPLRQQRQQQLYKRRRAFSNKTTQGETNCPGAYVYYTYFSIEGERERDNFKSQSEPASIKSIQKMPKVSFFSTNVRQEPLSPPSRNLRQEQNRVR